MKKTLLFIAAIAATMAVNAQGTWKATGTEAQIAPGTEIATGIANLKVVNSDPGNNADPGVIGKTDTGATDVNYHDVTWDNQAFVQGTTNNMYFAFLPAQSGTLDVSVKMGSGKKTFVLELTDAGYASSFNPVTPGDLAGLTTENPKVDGFLGSTDFYTLPAVYDTYNKTTGTWNNSTAIQSTGSNVYLVMSFPVTANKTYVVGCSGSKLMLRGVNYIASGSSSSINQKMPEFKLFPNPASGKVYMNVSEPTAIGIYNIAGALIKQQVATSSQNAINISDLHSGVYFVKTMNNNMTQKLIIR